MIEDIVLTPSALPPIPSDSSPWANSIRSAAQTVLMSPGGYTRYMKCFFPDPDDLTRVISGEAFIGPISDDRATEVDLVKPYSIELPSQLRQVVKDYPIALPLISADGVLLVEGGYYEEQVLAAVPDVAPGDPFDDQLWMLVAGAAERCDVDYRKVTIPKPHRELLGFEADRLLAVKLHERIILVAATAEY